MAHLQIDDRKMKKKKKVGVDYKILDYLGKGIR